MTSERDSMLETLFEIAGKALSADAFVAEVMGRIGKLRRRAVIAWCCVILLALPVVWLLSGPTLEAVRLTAEVLPASLVDVDERWLQQLLSPVNSIAGAVALSLLGLRLVYKRLFAR